MDLTTVTHGNGTVEIHSGEEAMRHAQTILMSAYKSAWDALSPLWCEAKRVAVDENAFPDIDLSTFKSVRQSHAYVHGISALLKEMFSDLGCPRPESGPRAVAGTYVDRDGKPFTTDEMKDFIAFETDRSRPYPW